MKKTAEKNAENYKSADFNTKNCGFAMSLDPILICMV